MQIAWHNWKGCEEQANAVEGKNDKLNLLQWRIMLWLTNAYLFRGSSGNHQYSSLNIFNPCCHMWTGPVPERYRLVWSHFPTPLSCFCSFIQWYIGSSIASLLAQRYIYNSTASLPVCWDGVFQLEPACSSRLFSRLFLLLILVFKYYGSIHTS